ARAGRRRGLSGRRAARPAAAGGAPPTPRPPVSHEAPMAELVAALAGAGLTPFPMPLGVQLDEARPEQSKCIRCNTCDGFPCLVGGKADAHVIAVAPALAHPNVTLVTGATVKRLVTGASGPHVDQGEGGRAGTVEPDRGDVVVVSAGAINSAAILLRSASDRHPHG